MADQPDPPEKWRVYEEDQTPDPEPPPEPPKVPYGDAPKVPYGDAPHVPYGGPQPTYNPVFVTTTSTSFAPKLILLVVAVAVLGAVVAGAIAIFASVDGGIAGISGSSVDPKQPEDFEEMVEALEGERGSTEVFSVGLYDGYAILYVPVDDKSTRSDALRWDGGGLEEWTKSTSTEQRFDLADIDASVIEGMCDPVLEAADGATASDCNIQIRKPTSDDAWFSAGASDEYGQYFSVMYDKMGNEVSRYPQ